MTTVGKFGNFNRFKKILKNNITPLIFCLLYTAAFSAATILKYDTFNASIMDLGAEMHNLFLISKGCFYWFKPNGVLTHASILAGYFEILYVPLGFIYKIIPHVWFFLILQSFLIGVSAFPFYYIAKEIIGEKWGFIGPLLILLNPQIHTGNMDDFHISVFYVPLISFALYFAFKKRTFFLYLFSFLVLIVKVDSFLYVTSIAVFMLLTGYKKKDVALLTVAAWIYGLFTIFYILPHLQGNNAGRLVAGTGHSLFLVLTEGIKDFKTGNITGFLFSIINPVIENIRYNFRYLLYLLAALGFMPLFSKRYLIIILIPLSVCWLAGFYPGHFYYYEPFLILQYSYFVVPFFVLASVYGLKNTINFIDKTDLKAVKRYFAVIFTVLILAASGITQNYSSIANFGLFNIFNFGNYRYKKNMHSNDLKKAFRKIKPDYSVSASNFIGSHLYNHYAFNEFPVGIKSADYIVFSTCYFIPYNKKRDLELLYEFNLLKNSGRYITVYKKGCNTILKLKKI